MQEQPAGALDCVVGLRYTKRGPFLLPGRKEEIMWLLLGTTITTSFFDSLNPSAIAQQMLLQAMVKKKSGIFGFLWRLYGFLSCSRRRPCICACVWLQFWLSSSHALLCGYIRKPCSFGNVIPGLQAIGTPPHRYGYPTSWLGSSHMRRYAPLGGQREAQGLMGLRYVQAAILLASHAVLGRI